MSRRAPWTPERVQRFIEDWESLEGFALREKYGRTHSIAQWLRRKGYTLKRRSNGGRKAGVE